MAQSYSKPFGLMRRPSTGRMLGLSLLLVAGTTKAQLSLTAPNTPVVITFDGTLPGVSDGAWAGLGFQPTPTTGQLDSDAWASFGWSDGTLLFGGTRVTAGTDFRRGSTAPGNGVVATAGLYSFGGPGISGRALGIQPNAGNFEPGTIGLRIQNNSGGTLTEIEVAYELFYRNDQPRSTNFAFQYSSDLVNYTTVAGLDVVSPEAATGTAWVANPRSTTITGLNLPNGAYFYIRWYSTLLGGTGNRDEFALDDISITGVGGTSVLFSGIGASVLETDGTTPLSVSIVNPDPVNATSVDVVLISGDADRINGFSSQTVTFPGGSGADQVVTIDITDNGACDGSETLVFQLQNLTGGMAPTNLTAPIQFTLEITDDNTSAQDGAQAFDGGPGDNWTINAGAAQVSNTTGALDTPVNQRIISGTDSWQVNNAVGVLDLAPFDVQDWSGIELTARVMSLSVNATNNGADLTDSISFFLALNGAAFSNVPDLVIKGSNTGNSRWGHLTGIGVASTTAGVPVTFQPAGAGLRTTDGYSTVRITVPNGTSSVALRIRARNNASQECWSVDNIGISGILCESVYYSRANGSEGSATWSTTRSGSPAPFVPTFSKNTEAYIQSGHAVTTSANATIDLRTLHVEAGGSLALTGSTSLGVHGSVLSLYGPLTGSDASLRFPGSEALSIEGDQTLLVNDILIGAAAVTQNVNTISLRRNMELGTGSYDVNNVGNPTKDLFFLSDANGTARLGPIIAPASFQGNIQMQRYVPGGATNWRLISAPTLNSRLSSLEDDFITAGYPGSHSPNFDSPVGSGILWPSIRTYDETVPGTGANDGLIGATSDMMVMAPGLGFMAWAGTSLYTTTPFTIDLRSSPHQGAPAITLPMTWTDHGTPTADGWNLVGNPLPSPIDFGSISLGADVQNYYYVYNPATGNNAIWDESLGVSIPGGALNGNIQSFQGFWLKANGPAVTTTVEEADKVLDPNGGGLFGGQQADPGAMFRLSVSVADRPWSDEALVVFGTGAPALGESDITKLVLSHPDAPRISTFASSGEELMLNAYGSPLNDLNIPVAVHTPRAGTYSIRIHGAEALMGTRCLVLEDLVTGTSTPLTEGMVHTFTSTGVADGGQRFVIHASAPVQYAFTQVDCAGNNSGAVTVTGAGTGPWNITWMDAFGTVLGEQAQATGPVTIDGLTAGNYRVAVSSDAGCGALTASFAITEPLPLEATIASVKPASCDLATDGAIALEVLGGALPYAIDWNNGATGAQISGLAAGVYTPTVTDANGCPVALASVEVIAAQGPTSSFLLSSTGLAVGDTLLLFNLGGPEATYHWSFGDGGTADESEPEHVFTAAGTYAVTLTSTLGDCSTSTTLSVVVGSTSVAPTAVKPVDRAWSDGDRFIVETAERPAGTWTIDMLDATGRLLHTVRRAAQNNRIIVPADGLPNGVYFLRTTFGQEQRTHRVPMLR